MEITRIKCDKCGSSSKITRQNAVSIGFHRFTGMKDNGQTFSKTDIDLCPACSVAVIGYIERMKK